MAKVYGKGLQISRLFNTTGTKQQKITINKQTKRHTKAKEQKKKDPTLIFFAKSQLWWEYPVQENNSGSA